MISGMILHECVELNQLGENVMAGVVQHSFKHERKNNSIDYKQGDLNKRASEHFKNNAT